MQKEPATIITAITGLITEIIGLLVAFNIDISDSQQSSIISTVTALSAVIVLIGPVIRKFVWSPHSVKEAVTAVSGSPAVANSVVEAGGATDASIVYTGRNDT